MPGRKSRYNHTGHKFRDRSDAKRGARESRTRPSPAPRGRGDVALRVLLLSALCAVGLYAARSDCLSLRRVEINCGPALTNAEVLSLSALDDCRDLWAVFIPCDVIKEALEAHPLIETADVSLVGLRTIRIQTKERRPIAALECNGYRLAFDGTGELLATLHPQQIYDGLLVRGVPLGLLRTEGTPIHTASKAWRVSSSDLRCDFLEHQFQRILELEGLLACHAGQYEDRLVAVSMDRRGRLTVEYANRPPVLLGRLEHPAEQCRRLAAVLGEPTITDTARVMEINLASLDFPYYRLKKEFYGPDELTMSDTTGAGHETGRDLTDNVIRLTPAAWQQAYSGDEERGRDMSIPDLASEATSDG